MKYLDTEFLVQKEVKQNENYLIKDLHLVNFCLTTTVSP